jgi:hypothetical protein
MSVAGMVIVVEEEGAMMFDHIRGKSGWDRMNDLPRFESLVDQ